MSSFLQSAKLAVEILGFYLAPSITLALFLIIRTRNGRSLCLRDQEFENVSSTLTRAQAECTKLVNEKRELRGEFDSLLDDFTVLARLRGSLDAAASHVKEFHERFSVPFSTKPTIISKDRATLRMKLIDEEATELRTAMQNDDLVEVADGIADLIYVAIGAAIEYGIPLSEVWDEVHATNMLKVGGAERADGKILKPEGWKPPQIEQILQRAQLQHPRDLQSLEEEIA
jgi:predicted HAD superfamily Cof-like phosphohydrolase